MFSCPFVVFFHGLTLSSHAHLDLSSIDSCDCKYSFKSKDHWYQLFVGPLLGCPRLPLSANAHLAMITRDRKSRYESDTLDFRSKYESKEDRVRNRHPSASLNQSLLIFTRRSGPTLKSLSTILGRCRIRVQS